MQDFIKAASKVIPKKQLNIPLDLDTTLSTDSLDKRLQELSAISGGAIPANDDDEEDEESDDQEEADVEDDEGKCIIPQSCTEY